MADLPQVGKIFMMVCPGIIVVVWILMIGYVYGDAKRRGMRHVMWTLLAIFIPDMIGVILYFILRDPLMNKCPG
ncbi:MAG: PLDc N-terminal domain-containing protein, partial [Candidatus Acidiferrales bacterium]